MTPQTRAALARAFFTALHPDAEPAAPSQASAELVDRREVAELREQLIAIVEARFAQAWRDVAPWLVEASAHDVDTVTRLLETVIDDVLRGLAERGE